MNILKLIGLTLFQPIKQTWLLPHTIATAFRQRQQQIRLNNLETERLDRIRNPSKYIGK